MQCEDSFIHITSVTRDEASKSCPPRYLDEGPHGEEVGQHGGQALGQTALGNEASLQLRQADSIVALLPVPAWNVQQMGLHQTTDTKGHETQKTKQMAHILAPLYFTVQ